MNYDMLHVLFVMHTQAVCCKYRVDFCCEQSPIIMVGILEIKDVRPSGGRHLVLQSDWMHTMHTVGLD